MAAAATKEEMNNDRNEKKLGRMAILADILQKNRHKVTTNIEQAVGKSNAGKRYVK